jgi:hypothetical protein
MSMILSAVVDILHLCVAVKSGAMDSNFKFPVFLQPGENGRMNLGCSYL